MSLEIWLSVVCTGGLYEVSSLGRVRSTDRIVPHRTSGKLKLKGRLLKMIVGVGGYYYVTICINACRVKKYCHELVCEAFHGPRPNGYQIDHKDRNRLNNNVDNLQYKTVLENCGMPGSRHPRSILTEGKVLEIRKKYIHRVYTYKMLGKEYGVDPTCIGHIIKRRLWNHI